MSANKVPIDSTHPALAWRVNRVGNCVRLEWMCKNNYAAMELEDTLRLGVESGLLELEFEPDAP
jgi:hypothetical protein